MNKKALVVIDIQNDITKHYKATAFEIPFFRILSESTVNRNTCMMQ